MPRKGSSSSTCKFPISRDPPEGGTLWSALGIPVHPQRLFPISRDPPEGGTTSSRSVIPASRSFPISRDPPEGGTHKEVSLPRVVP